MTSNKKDPVLVVLQMTGAYDALNTFVPYSDPHYVDYRANLQIGPDQVLAVDDKVGFHPGMDQIKKAKADGMSEDDQKVWEGEVQDMTNKFIAQIDEQLESKQAEIMQV